MATTSTASFNVFGKKIGIVGATGAVGIEAIKCLPDHIPVSSLRLFASARSKGKPIQTPFGEILVEEFSVKDARETDILFMAVSGSFATQYALEISADGGPVVIDNSSAFRYQDDIPLVVPEINGHTILNSSRLIANPNCTTAISAMALWPLHREFTLKKVIVSSYQAASGAGAEGMEELRMESAKALAGEKAGNSVFAHPLPFNVVPHIDKFEENGYTREEMKVAWETRKIFALPDLAVSCTAVRVPTLRAHGCAITIETEKEITAEAARKVLASMKGVEIVDDPASKRYPMPLTASCKSDVEVGRIRENQVFGKNGLDFFVCGDQLLRGAALNAVLIGATLLDANSSQ